ncbi:hypothetical protein ANCDUO_25475 [Ancylostoma duodenale]|uniref:Uncharacterized protein n=1 Tax=Ancylostoma duodenale TaxID=51022 RepID=A0A0C2FCR1_9BILA|nr:hypothetical protein ANCDUO_25475 [Ancylostoma duodenale]
MTQRLQTLQDWSNKHVFTSSMDYWNQDPPDVESYDMRRQRTVQRQPNYAPRGIPIVVCTCAHRVLPQSNQLTLTMQVVDAEKGHAPALLSALSPLKQI